MLGVKHLKFYFWEMFKPEALLEHVDDVFGSLESLHLDACNVRDSVMELIREKERLERALEAEKKYREAAERILGHGVQMLTETLCTCTDVEQSSYNSVMSFVRQLQRSRFGRFIGMSQGSTCQEVLEVAMALLKSAAADGHVESNSELANCYGMGNGIGHDWEQAAKYAKIAADHGCSYGEAIYGYCLYFGYGVEKDEDEALKYLKKSADQGNPRGQRLYGELANPGDTRVTYYQYSAAHGDSRGLWLFGCCLQYGDGVAYDFEKAGHCFKLSADQGDPDGQYRYGKWLQSKADSLSYSKDKTKKVEARILRKQAFQYLKKSFYQGNSDGQTAYAECFERGLGVRQSQKQAASIRETTAAD